MTSPSKLPFCSSSPCPPRSHSPWSRPMLTGRSLRSPHCLQHWRRPWQRRSSYPRRPAVGQCSRSHTRAHSLPGRPRLPPRPAAATRRRPNACREERGGEGEGGKNEGEGEETCGGRERGGGVAMWMTFMAIAAAEHGGSWSLVVGHWWSGIVNGRTWTRHVPPVPPAEKAEYSAYPYRPRQPRARCYRS